MCSHIRSVTNCSSAPEARHADEQEVGCRIHESDHGVTGMVPGAPAPNARKFAQSSGRSAVTCPAEPRFIPASDTSVRSRPTVDRALYLATPCRAEDRTRRTVTLASEAWRRGTPVKWCEREGNRTHRRRQRRHPSHLCPHPAPCARSGWIADSPVTSAIEKTQMNGTRRSMKNSIVLLPAVPALGRDYLAARQPNEAPCRTS